MYLLVHCFFFQMFCIKWCTVYIFRCLVLRRCTVSIFRFLKFSKCTIIPVSCIYKFSFYFQITCIYWCTVSIFRCLVFIGALVLSMLSTIQRFEPEMSVAVMVLVIFFHLYETTPIKYTAIFHCSTNDNFQKKFS